MMLSDATSNNQSNEPTHWIIEFANRKLDNSENAINALDRFFQGFYDQYFKNFSNLIEAKIKKQQTQHCKNIVTAIAQQIATSSYNTHEKPKLNIAPAKIMLDIGDIQNTTNKTLNDAISNLNKEQINNIADHLSNEHFLRLRGMLSFTSAFHTNNYGNEIQPHTANQATIHEKVLMLIHPQYRNAIENDLMSIFMNINGVTIENFVEKIFEAKLMNELENSNEIDTQLQKQKTENNAAAEKVFGNDPPCLKKQADYVYLCQKLFFYHYKNDLLMQSTLSNKTKLPHPQGWDTVAPLIVTNPDMLSNEEKRELLVDTFATMTAIVTKTNDQKDTELLAAVTKQVEENLKIKNLKNWMQSEVFLSFAKALYFYHQSPNTLLDTANNHLTIENYEEKQKQKLCQIQCILSMLMDIIIQIATVLKNKSKAPQAYDDILTILRGALPSKSLNDFNNQIGVDIVQSIVVQSILPALTVRRNSKPELNIPHARKLSFAQTDQKNTAAESADIYFVNAPIPSKNWTTPLAYTVCTLFAGILTVAITTMIIVLTHGAILSLLPAFVPKIPIYAYGIVTGISALGTALSSDVAIREDRSILSRLKNNLCDRWHSLKQRCKKWWNLQTFSNVQREQTVGYQSPASGDFPARPSLDDITNNNKKSNNNDLTNNLQPVLTNIVPVPT